MPDDILIRIGGDQADPFELEDLLFQYFKQSTMPTARSVTFGEGEAAATLRFDERSGRPISIEPGPAWQPEDEEQLRAAVHEKLLASGPTRITRRVLFSSAPAIGAYRYRYDFQFLPLPADAPRPGLGWSDEHPFLLEVAYPSSSDMATDMARRDKREREVCLLLSTLLSPSPHSRPREYQQAWVDEQEVLADGLVNVRSRLLTLGYTWPGANYRVDSFTPVAEFPAIEAVEPQPYFGAVGRGPGQPFQVPTTLTASLERVGALAEAPRHQFMLACYWFQQFLATRSVSRSISFNALVSAVEALMPKPSEKKCEACGRPRSDGPTKAFRDFLDHHVPEVPQSERNRFYSLRSSISHGSRLLLNDEIGWGGGPHAMGEEHDAMQLHTIVRAALLNWLHEGTEPDVHKLSGLWHLGA